MIAGLVARGDKFSPQALVVSPCGRRVAFVGPTEFTVTIADSMGLDEVACFMFRKYMYSIFLFFFFLLLAFYLLSHIFLESTISS